MSLNKDLQHELISYTSVRPIGNVGGFVDAGIALGYVRADVTGWRDAIVAMALDLAVLDVGQGLGNLFSKLENMTPEQSTRVLRSIFRSFDLEPEQLNADKLLKLEAALAEITLLNAALSSARDERNLLPFGDARSIFTLGIELTVAANTRLQRQRDRLLAELAEEEV